MTNLLNNLFQGDGAPADTETETTKIIPLHDVENLPSGIYLNLKVDVILISLFVLALSTRLYRLDEPRYIV